MSHDSCPTILTQSVAQCAQICADGGATIKQSPRLMALSQSADVDARTRGHGREKACALDSDRDMVRDACIPLVAPLTRFRDLCDPKREAWYTYA